MGILGDSDKAFTWISKKVLQDGTMSIVSYSPAEIIHHIDRRLTNPNEILAAENLVPLTGAEHAIVHDGSGRIQIKCVGFGKFSVTDLQDAHFLVDTMGFMKSWNKYLWLYMKKEGLGRDLD